MPPPTAAAKNTGMMKALMNATIDWCFPEYFKSEVCHLRRTDQRKNKKEIVINAGDAANINPIQSNFDVVTSSRIAGMLVTA